MKARLAILGLLLMFFIATASAEPAGWESWLSYYQNTNPDKTVKVHEAGSTLFIYYCEGKEDCNWDSKDGIFMGTRRQIPVTNNVRNMNKYTDGTVFMVFDEDWKTVLTTIPLSIWVGKEDCNKVFEDNDETEDFPYTPKCAYPLLIYHVEGNRYHSRPIDDFLEDRYEADRVIRLAKSSDRLPRLSPKIKESPVHLPLDWYYISSYWSPPKGSKMDVVYVVGDDDDYPLAMLAAQYASYINAPLVIEGVLANQEKAFENTNLICVGGVPDGVTCQKEYDKKQLQEAIISLTASDKVVITNPNDIQEGYCEDLEQVTEHGKMGSFLCRDSLVATYLATAKEEIMIHLDLPPSYSRAEMKELQKGFEENEDFVIGYIPPSPIAASSKAVYASSDAPNNKDRLYVIEFKDRAKPHKIKQTYVINSHKCTDDIDITDIAVYETALYVVLDCVDEDKKHKYYLQIYSLQPDGQIGALVDEMEFSTLRAIERNGNYLYAIDKNRIKVFEIAGNTLKQIQNYRSRKLPNKDDNYPTDLTIDGDVLYVSVGKYSNPLNTFRKPEDIIYSFRLETEGKDKGEIDKLIDTLDPERDWDEFRNNEGTFDYFGDMAAYGGKLYFMDCKSAGGYSVQLSNCRLSALDVNDGEFGDKPVYYGDGTGSDLNEDERDRYYQKPTVQFIVGDALFGPTVSREFGNIIPSHLTISDGFLYATVPRNYGIQIFDVSQPELKYHFLWSPQESITKPVDLIPKVKEAITEVLPVEVINYFTYLASPIALQFSAMDTGAVMSAMSQRSVDYLLTRELTNPDKDDSGRIEERYLKVKPYGRIYGLSISDTSTYVSRSIFSEDLKRSSLNIVVAISGEDTPVPTYFHAQDDNIKTWVGEDYDVKYYISQGAKGTRPAEFETTLPKFPEERVIEVADFVFMFAHGFPVAALFERPDKLIYSPWDLELPIILALSCSTLDYYNVPTERGHEVSMGMDYIRNGAMGYLGAVTSSGNAESAVSFRSPLETLLKERPPIGKLISLPLHSLEPVKTSPTSRLTSDHRGYETYFTLLGDPTYKPLPPVKG